MKTLGALGTLGELQNKKNEFLLKNPYINYYIIFLTCSVARVLNLKGY